VSFREDSSEETQPHGQWRQCTCDWAGNQHSRKPRMRTSVWAMVREREREGTPLYHGDRSCHWHYSLCVL